MIECGFFFGKYVNIVGLGVVLCWFCWNCGGIDFFGIGDCGGKVVFFIEVFYV